MLQVVSPLTGRASKTSGPGLVVLVGGEPALKSSFSGIEGKSATQQDLLFQVDMVHVTIRAVSVECEDVHM